MVQTANDIFFFDTPLLNFSSPELLYQEKISFKEPVLDFDKTLIQYVIQPDNKINKVNVDRQADLIFKKGDYLHTYITIDSTGIPDGTQFRLYDEDNNVLYSPFTPDGDYQRWMCTIIVNHVDVIPLPANYKDFDDWVDFEPGIYNWKLVSIETNEYKSITIDLQVEIRDFDVWEPIVYNIYAGDPEIIYKIRTYDDLIPYTTDLLTENATYDPTKGEITYPISDLEDTVGEHYIQIGNRVLYYVINQVNNYLLNLVLNENGDLEYIMESERDIADNADVIGTIELSDNDISVEKALQYGVNNIRLNNNGDLIFDTIEFGDE